MGEFKLHDVRFFRFMPKAIHSIAHQQTTNRVAVSRSDGSIEIYSINDNWYQEKLICGDAGRSVEAMVWVGQRLFSAGLHGDIIEYDMTKLTPKYAVDSYGGAVWCMAANNSQSTIAVGSEDGCVRLFEVTEGELSYSRAFKKQEERILSLAWHESGEVLVTGSCDNIRVWDVATGLPTLRIKVERLVRTRETIVWCVAILRDFTIVSGDSLGKTRFWNGKHGTLIQSHHCHKADVLSMCVSKDETLVWTAGVDPKVIRFEKVAGKDEGSRASWVRHNVAKRHTHDVRALVNTGEYVVSGGVDMTLVAMPVGKLGKQSRNILPFPQRRLVHVADTARTLLFQYQTRLELWQLGNTAAVSGLPDGRLPINQEPVSLLDLKTKNMKQIVCSAVSGCGTWVAYGDAQHVRLFHLPKEEGVKVKVQRVRCLPIDLRPAHHMIFTHDASGLVTATNQGAVQLLRVDAVHPVLVHTFVPPETGAPPTPISALAVSSDSQWIAAAHLDCSVHVYNIKARKHQCSLPKHPSPVSAMTFHPTKPWLMVVHSSQQFFEYDVLESEYTDWSRIVQRQRLHQEWLKRSEVVTQVAYNPANPTQILLQDQRMFCIIDKDKKLPRPGSQFYSREKLMRMDPAVREENRHAFAVCRGYRALLHVSFLEDGAELVAVERPIKAVTDKLPPTLSQKRFGT
ncbi:U3 small nucleolar RNA-associated protein 4 homolog [Branchiostoma floridae x Branchiostoma belcheri]